MANKEQLGILKRGVDEWNEWRREHPDVRPDLGRADLRGAVLNGADLGSADLGSADLEGAILEGAILEGAILEGAILTWADFRRAVLRGAVLSGAVLEGAVLEGAVLIGADLIGADLIGADLRGAVLTKADLREADLREAVLEGADLREAVLEGVVLEGAVLSGTHLEGAILAQALTGNTLFADTDLRSVQGLETIRHRGPSTIGVDTLYKSDGKIPEAFLRGCGVPNSLIEYLPSLIGAMQPIQFYSCFISYSTKDEDFAKRLHGRMQQEHLRVWFAPEDIKGGRKIHEQLEEAIRIYDKLLLVLSEHSIQSEWVTTEIYNARQAELRQQRRKLFPIRLVSMDAIKAWKCFDADTGKDLAREVREYHIPDFSHWKDHDAFEATFARLLRDLKATEALPAPAPVTVPPALAAPPDAARTHLQELITTKTRRLHHLEQQQAFKGANTPAEVLMELEDLRRELADLEKQLAEIDG